MHAFDHQWAVLSRRTVVTGAAWVRRSILPWKRTTGTFGRPRTHKVNRIRHNPTGQLPPCAPDGRVTGAAVPCRIRVLQGTEAAHAERAIERESPIIQGVLVSLLKTVRRDPGVFRG